MYALFAIPAATFLLILAASIRDQIGARPAKPMLDQIKDARQDARAHRELTAYAKRRAAQTEEASRASI
jgi:hypothetical protein